jgi:predicted alpha/beta-fold hydrolase
MLSMTDPRARRERSAGRLRVASGPDFRPPVVLGNRHVQSMISHAPWRRSRIAGSARQLLETAREHVLDCGDGVRLQGFMSATDGNQRGVVVLLHGWEGSAHSAYILSAGSHLLAAGFSVFRLNLRDHGDTKTLNEGLFHSCRIDEVVGAVSAIREQVESPFFALVGQSLGGNFALRVAARAHQVGFSLDRVIAVCPVLRPHSTMQALDGGVWIYRHYFLARWRRSLEEKAAAFPHLYRFGDLSRFRTLTETTAFFVEHYTEFDNLDDYLAGYAITGDVLAGLQVPSRIILAADDPVIPIGDLDNVAPSNALEATLARRGGHCGFVDSVLGSTWIDREILDDLDRFAQPAASF